MHSSEAAAVTERHLRVSAAGLLVAACLSACSSSGQGGGSTTKDGLISIKLGWLDRVVPDYPPYVERMVMDNAYYRTLARPGVRLVTEPIQRATATGLMTLDGGHHDLDVPALANGFRGTQFRWPLELRGRSGRAPSKRSTSTTRGSTRAATFHTPR